MTLPKSCLGILAALVFSVAASTSVAQMSAPRPRTSPHETVSMKIDGNRVTIVYGRPYSKNPKTGEMRKVWGELVPFGKIWRTGADEATLLITQKDIVLGGATVPAGAYTLFTLPEADGSAKLIVNKQIGQWGIDPYDESTELVRIPLTKEAQATPIDQFSIAITKGDTGGGLLRLAWQDVAYSVAFRLKN